MRAPFRSENTREPDMTQSSLDSFQSIPDPQPLTQTMGTFVPMPDDIEEVPDYEALAVEAVVSAARRGDAQEIQKAVEFLDTLRGLPEAVDG